ncbi:MAG: LacI family DNA-binding transcriptional regulator [Verrucomicrobiota bacterium]|nr:LacI family DNA-binding transcriptional regulator [Verrucomicrobiota bacterium]
MDKRPVRLKDIAARLNISTATVSLALSNHPRIPIETRRKVEAMASMLGYQRNPLVSQLAANRWQSIKDHPRTVIAFIWLDKLKRSINHPWSGVIKGIEAEAHIRGYQVQLFNLFDYPSSAALDRILYSRGIQGIIVGRIYDKTPRLNLQWTRYAAICCGSSVYRFPLHGVAPNHFTVIEKTWARLRSLGYRRIGVVLVNISHRLQDDDLRMGAVMAELQHLKPDEIVPPLFIQGAQVESIPEWYSRHRPDAVIGMNSSVWEILTRVGGWNCPGDFAFANLHLQENDQQSGIVDMDTRLGQSAIQLLVTQLSLNLRGTSPLPMWHELEPEWVERGTCPPVVNRKKYR